MALVDAVRAKADSAIRALVVGDPAVFEPLLTALGDHGTGPVYDTVTIDGDDFLVGQSWSGPPDDPAAPEDGPQAAMENLSFMSQVVAALGGAIKPTTGVVTAAKATGAAATLTYDTLDVDADLYTHSSGELTVLTAGTYEMSVSLWGDSASDDTVVRVWVEVDSSEQAGSRAVITVPTTAAAGITEGSCSIRVSVALAANAVVRVRHQRTVGTALNIQRGSFEIRMTA